MRKRNKKITTPVGKAIWPHLNTPDTTFDKDGGIYAVTLRLHASEATELIEEITSVFADNMAKLERETGKKPKAASMPVKDSVDEDGNPTGEVDIKFKLKAVGKSGGDTWEQRPALFDSSGRPLTEVVGAGSTVKVGAEVVPYFTASVGAGVTLRLKAVQVIELVEYSKGGDFNAWSFEKEDGFVSKGKEEPTVADPVSSEPNHESGYDF
jgi:hypothetical protein